MGRRATAFGACVCMAASISACSWLGRVNAPGNGYPTVAPVATDAVIAALGVAVVASGFRDPADTWHLSYVYTVPGALIAALATASAITGVSDLAAALHPAGPLTPARAETSAGVEATRAWADPRNVNSVAPAIEGQGRAFGPAWFGARVAYGLAHERHGPGQLDADTSNGSYLRATAGPLVRTCRWYGCVFGGVTVGYQSQHMAGEQNTWSDHGVVIGGRAGVELGEGPVQLRVAFEPDYYRMTTDDNTGSELAPCTVFASMVDVVIRLGD